MAAAIVQIIAAIRGQDDGATAASAALSAVSDVPRSEVRSVSNGTTAMSGAVGDLDECNKSTRRINVYLAGSRGCATLARSYGPRIMAVLGLDKAPYIVKCGTTTLGLAERLRQIGQDGYGAAVRTTDGIEIEPGFSAWIAHTISISRRPRDPAIRIMPRVIAVDLPRGLTRRVFDAALHRALKSRSLASIPDREVPRRFVAYDLIETRVSAAAELYALSPHESADGDLLLDAIEVIIKTARAKQT